MRNVDQKLITLHRQGSSNQMRCFSPLALEHFSGRVIPGRGRGKTIKSPTINLSLQSIPKTIPQGIYACSVTIRKKIFIAAVHYGPRPVFNDGLSFEIHVIDTVIATPPQIVHVELIKRLRNVRNFPSPKALMQQIAKDIGRTRMLFIDSPHRTGRPSTLLIPSNPRSRCTQSIE